MQYRIETEVVSMEFLGLGAFQIDHGDTQMRFTPIHNYDELYVRTHFDVRSQILEPYPTTGTVVAIMEALDANAALGTVKELLFDLEHLLSLAHYHHVFFTALRCYEVDCKNVTAATVYPTRPGRAGRGCLLWSRKIPEFLQAALPRLEQVAGFRWALYWFNEMTIFSKLIVAQLEIPSLWVALEVMASSRAATLEKDQLLSDDQISTLKQEIRPILKKMGLKAASRGQIYGHLPGLKHPVICDLAQDLLNTYGFADHAEEIRTFYKVRNDVVHGRNMELKEVDLRAKIIRFRRLLHKLLFSMAGVYGDPDTFRAPIRAPDLSAL
jgi:hypothetical protein